VYGEDANDRWVGSLADESILEVEMQWIKGDGTKARHIDDDDAAIVSITMRNVTNLFGDLVVQL
jgi:hypothetical protein